MKKLLLILLFAITYYNSYSQTDTLFYANVEEKPRFAECKEVAKTQEIQCFKEQMDKIIREYIKNITPQGTCGFIQGRVNVSFCINPDGTTKVLQMKSTDKDWEAITLRIIASLPPFIPATQNGKPVVVKILLPIRFELF